MFSYYSCGFRCPCCNALVSFEVAQSIIQDENSAIAVCCPNCKTWLRDLCAEAVLTHHLEHTDELLEKDWERNRQIDRDIAAMDKIQSLTWEERFEEYDKKPLAADIEKLTALSSRLQNTTETDEQVSDLNIPKEPQTMRETFGVCPLCRSVFDVEYCQLPTKTKKFAEVRCPCCNNFLCFVSSLTEPKYVVHTKTEIAEKHKELIEAAQELPDFVHCTFGDYYELD